MVMDMVASGHGVVFGNVDSSMFVFRDGYYFMDKGGEWYNNHFCLVNNMRSDYKCSGCSGILAEMEQDVTTMSTW